jgi:beta-N-acetylhexosaminidase
MQKLSAFLNSDSDKNFLFATDLGWLMASEVIASGLDISFAPVLDLDDSRSSVIGNRSIGDNPEQVIAIASAFIAGMNQAGMQATGKHFPGHGGIFTDSHLTFSQDTRSLSELESHDLLPFDALKLQLGGIMTAHISFTNIDKEIATFSKFWLQDILRKKMGFTGIIFSDDLSMKGSDYAGGIEAKVGKALESGCNMVLVCNDRPAALEAINFLEKEKISQSHKITKLKASQSISWTDLEKDVRRKDIIGKLNTIEK